MVKIAVNRLTDGIRSEFDVNCDRHYVEPLLSGYQPSFSNPPNVEWSASCRSF